MTLQLLKIILKTALKLARGNRSFSDLPCSTRLYAQPDCGSTKIRAAQDGRKLNWTKLEHFKSTLKLLREIEDRIENGYNEQRYDGGEERNVIELHYNGGRGKAKRREKCNRATGVACAIYWKCCHLVFYLAI